MSRRPDAGCQLDRALERTWPGATVVRRRSTPWASVTFSGARHRIDLVAPGTPGLEDWIERLPEAELAMPGHLVADLSVRGVARDDRGVTVDLEVLTVES